MSVLSSILGSLGGSFSGSQLSALLVSAVVLVALELRRSLSWAETRPKDTQELLKRMRTCREHAELATLPRYGVGF